MSITVENYRDTGYSVVMMTKTDAQQGWYAFRIFRNGRGRFVNRLQENNIQYYFIEKVTQTVDINYNLVTERKLLFPSLIFVRATREWVVQVQKDPSSAVAPYTRAGVSEPALIPDREMELLMFVAQAAGYKLDAYDGDISRGDHVRVLDGVFKGAEGYVLRIHGNKRFVVSIQGIAAVATSYIPQNFLERIS